jgi:hypothetical protein
MLLFARVRQVYIRRGDRLWLHRSLSRHESIGCGTLYGPANRPPVLTAVAGPFVVTFVNCLLQSRHLPVGPGGYSIAASRHRGEIEGDRDIFPQVYRDSLSV